MGSHINFCQGRESETNLLAKINFFIAIKQRLCHPIYLMGMPLPLIWTINCIWKIHLSKIICNAPSSVLSTKPRAGRNNFLTGVKWYSCTKTSNHYQLREAANMVINSPLWDWKLRAAGQPLLPLQALNQSQTRPRTAAGSGGWLISRHGNSRVTAIASTSPKTKHKPLRMLIISI